MDIYYQNVNRIRSKLIDLNLNVLKSDYDIICLTETNLNPGVFNEEVLDTRYNVFRRDRCNSASTKSEGGGVSVAVKKSLDAVRCHNWDTLSEVLRLTVTSPNFKVHICVCYLPPDLSVSAFSDFYDSCVSIMSEFHSDKFLLVGDFNTPSIDWIADSTGSLLPSSSSDAKSALLLDTLSLCNLKQFNNVPNINKRFLDLVLSNIPSTIISEVSPLSKPDKHHPSLLLTIPFPTKPATKYCPKGTRPNYRKGNYELIKTKLAEIDWVGELADLDVDSAVNCFYQHLFDLIALYVPNKRDDAHRYPIW